VSYTDRTLTCSGCGAQFTFTAREQEFYASRGFDNEPKRCPDCRRARKSSRDSGDMGGGSYGGGGERQMYPATCANCGQQTEVPFQPRGTRPVYCRDCYRTMAPSGGGRGPR
jgi:CxxC-x17-CxxC domain-containing protein